MSFPLLTTHPPVCVIGCTLLRLNVVLLRQQQLETQLLQSTATHVQEVQEIFITGPDVDEVGCVHSEVPLCPHLWGYAGSKLNGPSVVLRGATGASDHGDGAGKRAHLLRRHLHHHL